MIATLIGGLLQWLKRRMICTSRGGGHWSPDDFDVRLGDAGGKVIGRIFRARSRRRIGLGSGRSLSASHSGRRRGVTLRRERMRWRISRRRGSASRDPQIRNLQWPLRCPGLRTPNILSTPPNCGCSFRCGTCSDPWPPFPLILRTDARLFRALCQRSIQVGWVFRTARIASGICVSKRARH